MQYDNHGEPGLGNRSTTNSASEADDGSRQGAERYVLISPVRNEAEFMRRTLDSVLLQSVAPARWIILDDGSTDETASILRDYAARHSAIEVHRLPDRGRRALGGGVVEVFNRGMALMGDDPAEFVCKLDMDLDLPRTYFERLLSEMHRDPRLGSVSGKPYFPVAEKNGELRSERIGDDVSAGMTKFYRRTFLEDIGGLAPGLMWDGIDCYQGRMKGWRSCSIDDPELRFIHLRPMGSSDRGILTGRTRLGQGYWYMGASLPFVMASALFRVRHKPAIIGSLATVYGYLRAWLRGVERYEDRDFRSFLRRYHRTLMFRGRRKAMSIIGHPPGIEQRTGLREDL